MSHLRLAWDATPPPPDFPQLDGRRITWSPWQQVRVFVCPPADPITCDECGSTEVQFTAHGTYHPNPGDTHLTTWHRTRSGREYEGPPHPVQSNPYVRLYACRCPDCGATDVVDRGESGMGWDVLTEPQQLELEAP